MAGSGMMDPDSVQVQFKGGVGDDLFLNEGAGWGFAMRQGTRSAFVSLGAKEDMEADIEKRGDDLVLLVIDAIKDSDDEGANFMLDEVLAGIPLFINGIPYSEDEISATVGCSGTE